MKILLMISDLSLRFRILLVTLVIFKKSKKLVNKNKQIILNSSLKNYNK